MQRADTEFRQISVRLTEFPEPVTHDSGIMVARNDNGVIVSNQSEALSKALERTPFPLPYAIEEVACDHNTVEAAMEFVLNNGK